MADDQANEMDEVNRAVWARDADMFAVEGWADPGELEAMGFLADSARGEPVIDIGVGGGRTVGLFKLLTSDYVAVDYTPELVELCRLRHPGIDVRLDDARLLGSIADGSVGLAAFSSNGIDAVGHEDRQKVLSAVTRVLRPGGLFFFSTLNKDGPLYGAHPGSAPDITWEPGTLLARHLDRPDDDSELDDGTDNATWILAVKNWRRLRGLAVEAGEWGLAPFAAHRFGLLTHFITVDGERAELDAHGLETLAVFPCHGGGPLPAGESTAALYVHLVARKK